MSSFMTWITDPNNPETAKKISIKVDVNDRNCLISVMNDDGLPFEDIKIENNGGKPTISFSSEIALCSDAPG